MIWQGYLQQLIFGAGVTLKIAALSLFLGLAWGLVGAAGESSRHFFLRYFFVFFHSIIRGVPELLILLFVYFSSSEIFNQFSHNHLEQNALLSAVIALGLIFGAYASQTFRGAFLAIPRGQHEAAKALGMNYWQIFQRILLPQAWRYALPGLGNLWLVLLKDTALVSLISLADLMLRSQNAAISTGKPFTFFLTAAIIYLFFTSLSEIALIFLVRRAQRPFAHQQQAV